MITSFYITFFACSDFKSPSLVRFCVIQDKHFFLIQLQYFFVLVGLYYKAVFGIRPTARSLYKLSPFLPTDNYVIHNNPDFQIFSYILKKDISETLINLPRSSASVQLSHPYRFGHGLIKFQPCGFPNLEV